MSRIPSIAFVRWFGTLAGLTAAAGGQPVSFNRDVRPIMADTCFRCHGPDSSSRMANLRLDRREEVLKPNRRGLAPIVPGDPAASHIIRRIFASDASVMPPRSAHKELSPKQKETLRRWVTEGAEYEGHWAYQPVRRPAVPEVPGGQLRNPIDNFIQDRLKRESLPAAAEADRRTLLRRVSLDLTGLLPAPKEMAAFLADPAPDAYERQVDRLLASPAFAERQAQHWLDAVRYADTSGFHGDNPFPAWPYRDYVLKSFLENKPFDQFTREQLAGDLLPNATAEQRTGSAFNRLTRTSAEGGIQPKEYLAKYAADRVRTLSAVWLGSTMGCAECHDHKFDPFTARDFYSMKAFFADIKETGLVPDRGPLAWGAQLALPNEDQRSRLASLDERLRQLDTKLTGLPHWSGRLVTRQEPAEICWQVQDPLTALSKNGALLKVYREEPLVFTSETGGSIVSETKPGKGLVVASGKTPDQDVYSVTIRPGAGSWAALGIEVMSDDSLPGARVGRGSDRFVLTGVEMEAVTAGRPAPLAFASAATNLTFTSKEMPAFAAIDEDPLTGWGFSTYLDVKGPFLALPLRATLKTLAATTLRIRLRQESAYRHATIGRFRVYLMPGEAPGIAPDMIARDRLQAEREMTEAGIPRVVVTESQAPETTRVLARGNFLDESGAEVEPAIPAMLGQLPASGRATRLDLANWLVSTENPLTARVQVNRLWRQLFGTGLSKTLEDMGSQGEWPTHPELLDWLAAELTGGSGPAWETRRIIRLIVLSHAYRQASIPDRQMLERDPDNRLLSRQNRARADAETVRDIALQISGLLSAKFGGPSVRPYQPEGYLAALNYPKRDYSASRGEDLYRRGLYTVWQRTFLHPSMAVFDAPSREECTVNRVSSNTPLQALTLLNDPIFVEAARVLAQRAAAGQSSFSGRLDWIFQQALQRDATAAERQVLAALYRRNLARYVAAPAQARQLLAIGDSPADPKLPAAQVAALTTVTRAVLNLHEVITRN
jgi:hypothetical protein